MDHRLTLIHGGQTGVDRGCHEAAIALGLPVEGYAPRDGCDEEGIIPSPVRERLWLCGEPGYMARTRWNLDRAHAVLVIVPDGTMPTITPGTRFTLDTARAHGKPRLACDPTWPTVLIRSWMMEWIIPLAGQNAGATVWGKPVAPRLMIAGPRASRWPEGQDAARDLLIRALTHPAQAAG